MHRVDSRTGRTFSDEKYVRVISHEMGHVFGVGDGYKDDTPLSKEEKEQGVVRRPDAYNSGLIDEDDVMKYEYNRLNISDADIGLLILAYWEDEHQSFTEFTGHKQSKYFQRGGKQ